MPRQNRKEKASRNCRLPETRVTENELAAIKSKAAKAGISQSEYQRRALLHAEVVIRENILEAKAVSQLSSIGNNLNQLVRKTHIHDKTDTLKMRQILETLDTVIMRLVIGS